LRYVQKILVIFVIIGFATQASANNNVLKIATFPFPPLLHNSVDGSVSGTMAETVKEICSEAGIECEFIVLPLKRAYHYLKNKQIDALVTLKFGQFNDCCVPSKWQSPWTAGLFSHLPIDQIPRQPTDIFGKSLIIVNGMRSPYLFMPDLDKWQQENKLELSSAKDIYTAVRMFSSNRAELLWGSDDFNWYFDKMDIEKNFTFLPLIARQVVVWVQKEKQPLLDKLDAGFKALERRHIFNSKNLLNDELMAKHYKDAPFNFKQ